MLYRTTWMLLLAPLITLVTLSTSYAADVNGVWLIESETAKVEIYDCDDKKCGKIVWANKPYNEDGSPRLDVNNPDEDKQSQPLLGSVMIWDMTPDGDNAWDSGKIYRATDGKTFKSKMELKDAQTLEVSGCVLFFCQEQTWTRSDL